MMHIEIRGASATCVQPQLLTVGMVGARVRFSFDESWAGLTRCAVFTDGMVTRDVLLEGESCPIPAEVLTEVGRVLCVGVYGTNEAGDMVIPTVFAQTGMVRPGALPSGDESYVPLPDVTGQIHSRIEALEARVKELAEGGTGGTGGSGTVSHSWNGTVLTVTSDAGSSSADLRGPMPVKGTDYFTAGDRRAMVDEVLAALPRAEEVGF